MNDLPEILTPYDIAGYLNISYAKALELIKYKGLKHMKVGRDYKVPKAKFELWLEEQCS